MDRVVFDSLDKTRIVIAKEELQQLLHSDVISQNIPILFFTDKKYTYDALSDVGVSLK